MTTLQVEVISFCIAVNEKKMFFWRHMTAVPQVATGRETKSPCGYIANEVSSFVTRPWSGFTLADGPTRTTVSASHVCPPFRQARAACQR